MKALIVGANTFVGRTLVKELDTLGFEVTLLCSSGQSSGDLDGKKYLRESCDSKDFDSLRRILGSTDYFFLLSGSRRGFQTEVIARAASKAKQRLSRFICVSHLAAAGPASSLTPRVETEIESPISAFGVDSLQTEKELQKFKNHFPLTILRPSLIYGPGDRNSFLLFQAIARNWLPVLRGATEAKHKYYSLVHVKDLCRGVVQAAVASGRKVKSGEIFYLSGDGVHTYQELATTIAEKLNRDPVKIHIPSWILKLTANGLNATSVLTRKRLPFHLDKVNDLLADYWVCSNAKAKKMLGFNPEIDLSNGISQSLDWYKKQKWI